MNKTILELAIAGCVFAIAGTSEAKYLRQTAPISQTNAAPAAVTSAPLFRKTMDIIGDSYVQNHHRPIEETWHYNLAAKYQMQYFNYGKNGNTLATPTEKNWGDMMVKRFGELHRPADYVVVIAGHNDASKMNPEDPADAERFKNGVRSLVEGLRKRHPSAKIVFVSPWGVKKPGFDIVLGIYREVLPQLGVAFFDAAKDSGIDPNDASVRARLFQSKGDTAHLNKLGHALMLEKMEPFFLSL